MNPILIMAVLSLVIGLFLYVWIVYSNASYFYTTNLISWLLIALFPVLLIFSFFPESSISGTIKGISMGGAIAAFIFIWWNGIRIAKDTAEVDRRIEAIRSTLSAQLQAREEALQQLKELQQHAPTVLHNREIFSYKLKARPGKQVGLITGDIRAVNVADVWVNSENTNMQMSRYFERSISGVIRYLGAKKDDVGNVVKDVVADELAQRMGPHLTVQPATVLVTEAGELQTTHNVKKIFHVAAVHGEIGHGYHPVKNIEACITSALTRTDSTEFKDVGIKSVLFPLMGAGTAKGNLKEIADRLLQAAISYLETTADTTIERIYFLVWSDIELETCRAILNVSDKLISLPKN